MNYELLVALLECNQERRHERVSEASNIRTVRAKEVRPGQPWRYFSQWDTGGTFQDPGNSRGLCECVTGEAAA